MTDTTEVPTRGRELPYEGTVADLRQQAATDGYRGQVTHGRLMADLRTNPDQHSPEAVRTQMLVAIAAANYGWSLAAVLGWLSAEHPDLAYQAGCIAQDVMINGGNRWTEDLPYPPKGETP